MFDLADQPLGITVDRLTAAHRLGVAAAVKADVRAIRDVNIKREVRVGRQSAKPFRINSGPTASEKCGAVG